MKSYIRPLGIIIISLFGFLLIISLYADKSNFEMNGKEMHQKVLSNYYTLSFGAEKQLENPILIDIRDADNFAINHLPKSINIPLPSILDESNVDLFRKANSKVILAYEPIKAHEAWMLLSQMGFENLFVMEMK
ncbi:MAG: rhodanese-related sulfurtransferase [Cyclobacteriaceae bacterium]|jgi:rhodanese-related sulfurtransferase